ncbi:RecX family transcriptional regulator [Candidatus Saccharibacteria bacterium]|nr:RecX family transcriptional regulator [Candidatus Saccharibacteria bacterium]
MEGQLKLWGDDVEAETSGLKITDIRQAVKNENRVNVFVNNKYAFSLDISQVVDFHIKKGLAISAEQLEEYKRASEFGKLYQRALEWTLTRPHSEREVRDYLRRKIYEKKVDKEYVDKILDKLKEKKYVNDEAFATYYVENRFVRRGISRKRLYMELMQKGVAQDIIEEALNARNDEDEILKIIAKKRAKYDDVGLIQYLCRQGFSYQLAQDLVRTYETDSQSWE